MQSRPTCLLPEAEVLIFEAPQRRTPHSAASAQNSQVIPPPSTALSTEPVCNLLPVRQNGQPTVSLAPHGRAMARAGLTVATATTAEDCPLLRQVRTGPTWSG